MPDVIREPEFVEPILHLEDGEECPFCWKEAKDDKCGCEPLPLNVVEPDDTH